MPSLFVDRTKCLIFENDDNSTIIYLGCVEDKVEAEFYTSSGVVRTAEIFRVDNCRPYEMENIVINYQQNNYKWFGVSRVFSIFTEEVKEILDKRQIDLFNNNETTN